MDPARTFRASAAALLLLIAFFFSEMLEPVSGTLDADRDVIIELEVEFDTIHRGSISFFMGNGERTEMDMDRRTWPSIEDINNMVLLKLYGNLQASSYDDTKLFYSVLNGSGDLEVIQMNVSFHLNETSMGVSIEGTFIMNSSSKEARYEYLSFLKPFRLPSLDRNDPASAIRYNNVVEEFSRVGIRISMDPPRSSNLDFQWDGSYHWRGPSGEGLRFSSDLVGFTGSGHEFSLVESPFLSPAATMYFTIAMTMIGTLASSLACFRKRFRRWALIIPSGAILLLPGPFLFYIRPYLNPYGLYDAGLVAVSVIFVGYSIFMNFAPSGKSKRTYKKVEEDLPKMKFRMPKVIYVDHPVFVKTPGPSYGGGHEDPYEVLGVDRTASMEEIDRAYRSKVLKCHPDRMRKAEDWVEEAARERTMRLNRAYEEVQKQQGKAHRGADQ